MGERDRHSSAGALRREIGPFGAVMMGLGSIVGTGIFVSVGIGAGVAGPGVLVALGIGALVAACNGLSSAQLAAAYPVSGGTYEYGYRLLRPWLGFTAGWTFLIAKSASAATAALGFAGYFLYALGEDGAGGAIVPVALGAVAALTALVLSGIRRSSAANVAIVSVTLLALGFFVVAGLPAALRGTPGRLTPLLPGGGVATGGGVGALLNAAALMFVPYTGYGRIATLGEEVRDPGRTIPRAIIATLAVTMVLYMSVAYVAIASVGAPAFAEAARGEVAPLSVVAGAFGVPGAGMVLAVGAVTAMLGVLLNLVLGLSRVVLAMGRRGDMPAASAAVAARTGAPWAATLVVAAAIGALVLVRDVRTTWAFSAFAVLIYYGLTNLAALRLPRERRLYPRWVAWCGLSGCLFLAFWVDVGVWGVGLGLIAAGLVWHTLARRVRRGLSVRPRAGSEGGLR